jgi:hypothetical protein
VRLIRTSSGLSLVIHRTRKFHISIFTPRTLERDSIGAGAVFATNAGSGASSNRD